MHARATSRLTAITVPSDPEPWADAGFAVGAGGFSAGEVAILFQPGVDSDAGVVLDPPSPLDGAGNCETLPATESFSREHPNGVVAVDHVVISTPDIERTREILEAAGLDLRLERETSIADKHVHQAFFLAENCVIELVGARDLPDGPACVWGVTFVTEDLDALAAPEDAPVASIKSAVQPGRRIAVARRELGLPTRVAFMDPRTKNSQE